MSDVNSWDHVEGPDLIAHLESEAGVIAALGERVLGAIESLAGDGRAGAKWKGESEATISGIARAANTATAQLRSYGEAMTAADYYDANLIRGDRD
ncbi:hypothetical protein ACNQVK_04610 [Mycobacterium sp. 134]|uniref:hypothetical protein n=1 Tax=Mycobacteriaceae TaxID=1762 RepID=UPI003AACC07C